MGTGQSFVKRIKPIGSAMFLLIFVMFLLVCFTAGNHPIAGYTAPHDSEYYAQSDLTLGALKTELEANVFPKLDGQEGCAVLNGKLTVTIDAEHFVKSRAAIIQYYDRDLFTFVKG